jgi:hypothetical protein
MQNIFYLIGLLLSISPVIAQQDQDDPIPIPKTESAYNAWASCPSILVKRFMDSGVCANYSIGFDAINPFFLQGDFDGDGLADYIVRVVQRKHGPGFEDLALLSSGGVRWLSKDIGHKYPGPSWGVVFKHEKILTSLFENSKTKPPKLLGDAIMMLKPEETSSILFWNGKRFDTYWKGD